jgi:tellurite resistance protein
VDWQLKPDALHALRDTLLERGVPSLRLTKPASVENSRETDTLLQRVAPFLELLYLMMVADGKCDERERRLLQGVTRTFCGNELSSAAVDELLTVFDANKDAEGVEARLETVAGGLSADKLDAEAAFTLTAVMAVADGDMGAPEHALLRELAQMLGIAANRARELVAETPLSGRTRPAP